MSLIPHDLTPVYNATTAKGTGTMQWQRPVYVDHLPRPGNERPARSSR
jgi:hypothetical protein